MVETSSGSLPPPPPPPPQPHTHTHTHTHFRPHASPNFHLHPVRGTLFDAGFQTSKQALVLKRIRHKILSATYRSVHDNTPLYLSDLLQKHNPSRLLRSASRSLLDVPGPMDSKTKRYGQRAFRYVAPSLWNVLPESIEEKDTIQSFRPSLKTHFFT